MSRRGGRLWALALSIVLAQVAVNVPFWFVTRQPVSSLFDIAAITGFTAIVFILIIFILARAHDVWIILLAFLCMVVEAVVIGLSPLGGPEGAHQFPWEGLIIGLVAAGVLLAVAAIYASDALQLSYFLDVLSRRLLLRPWSPGFGIVGRRFGPEDIRSAVPPAYPNGERSVNRRSRRADEPRDPRPTGLTEDLARGTAWVDQLLAANNRGRNPRGMPAPVLTAAGFVRTPRGARLGIIYYFRPDHLFQALLTMPRSFSFAGESFPVVARPWLPVQQAVELRAPYGRERVNDGHCWVTFGEETERYGVVTARHAMTKPDSLVGSQVVVRTLRTEIVGTLRSVSAMMDAALIELTEVPRPRLIPAPHSRTVGLKPIRLCTGHGDEVGYITAWGFRQDGIYARNRNPGGEPTANAQMFFNVTGIEGDSGSLVLDTEGERGDGDGGAPYAMYQGEIEVWHGAEGYGNLLDQIAFHWPVNFQFRLQPGDDSMTVVPRMDDRR